ncbi:glycoside hydrolase family 10 protein [Anaerorhabdus sp.]|jgi:uncharacterized lipoprotein YddW (UPF0748 family)|uniref:glycoside hydrolase family 10 protein n=1 Tax=Anaerorhabdus sp. TaxID=1872524 RepID=UPI002FCAA0F1
MINKICKIVLVSLLLMSCSSKKEAIHIPLPNEVKGMWFSYVDYQTFLKDTPKDKIEKKIEGILANCESIGINTIIVHAVAFTDSFYNSKIYPVSNKLNQKDIDYLKIFVDEAHERNMHVEAWINPMRSVSNDEVGKWDNEFILNKWINEGSDNIKLFEDRYYLNIATEDSQNLIISVVEEIVDNYDVDGIHMDDYFYPAKVDDSFDSNQYTGSSFTDIGEFRRYQVNTLVEKIYNVVHQKNLAFGISPSGNIEYSRDIIFGDTEAWIAKGIVDYVTPQIYWGFTNKNKPFEPTLQEWQTLVDNTNVKLIAGLAAYKVGIASNDSDNDEWLNDSEILLKQIQSSKNTNNYGGYMLFSYHSLFGKENENMLNNRKNLVEID